MQNEAELDGSRNVIVRAASGVSLDERIAELAKVPKFSASVPAAKPTVSSDDQAGMTANFADIASGKVRVE